MSWRRIKLNTSNCSLKLTSLTCYLIYWITYIAQHNKICVTVYSKENVIRASIVTPFISMFTYTYICTSARSHISLLLRKYLIFWYNTLRPVHCTTRTTWGFQRNSLTKNRSNDNKISLLFCMAVMLGLVAKGYSRILGYNLTIASVADISNVYHVYPNKQPMLLVQLFHIHCLHENNLTKFPS